MNENLLGLSSMHAAQLHDIRCMVWLSACWCLLVFTVFLSARLDSVVALLPQNDVLKMINVIAPCFPILALPPLAPTRACLSFQILFLEHLLHFDGIAHAQLVMLQGSLIPQIVQ